ncbi:MAG: hypothetical protein HY246_12855 [Proteobacteria bacterium]|nr:hypothetical protein [Pseudomonadota bacterium]
MSERTIARQAIEAALGAYNPADPSPWLALALDRAMPMDDGAKLDLLRSQASRSRQFLLPFVRPLARISIILVQLLRTLSPRRPNAPRLLHRLLYFGMKTFLRPDANRLILRHFNAASEILSFVADNATPGFRPDIPALRPRCLEDILDNVFLIHDLNIFNFVIQLNQELERRGEEIRPRAKLDFSAISDAPFDLAPMPDGPLNFIDLHTAIEAYTPVYALLLTDSDFWRASNSLQLDETVGIYAARLIDREDYLGLISNGHPMVPYSTLEAGFRLMLHGLAIEMLHGFLRRLKANRA